MENTAQSSILEGFFRTYHGTFVYLSKIDNTLFHRKLLPKQTSYHEMLKINKASFAGADSYWFQQGVKAKLGNLEIAFENGNFYLKNDDIYVTAEPDGRMTFHANAPREWETLNFVPAEDISLIKPNSKFQPRIWVKPLGNSGNRALQYLVAEGIRQFIPEATIENLYLPEWGIVSQQPEPELKNATRLGWDRFWIDISGLADCLKRSVVDTIILDSFSYNLDHYPPREIAKTLLGPTVGRETAKGFAADELVCSIRGAEVLQNAHPDYFVLPAGYYKKLAERSALKLVFFGQISNDAYVASLQQAFPDARFIQGRSAEYDFEMLRHSKNIAPSISTFAWLAAWLSGAEKIFLPVGGLFNPVQHPLQMYLPLNEPAYEFVLLPYCRAVDLKSDPQGFARQQNLLSDSARFVSVEELRDICARATALWPRQPRVTGFDPDYYMMRYQDVATEVFNGTPSALEHYIHVGFREKRQPFDFDSAFYVSAYPDAAMLVAEGHFADPLDHFISVGRAEGYLAVPG